ncbi:MAG: hypothetical protein AAGC72_14415 [Planctomycetota bacterium]
MTQPNAKRQADYTAVALQLATKALSVAVDAAPHRAKEGERRWSIAKTLPAARLLIDQDRQEDQAQLPDLARSLVETLADETGKVTDGFGHARPSYALFAIHLLGSAARLGGQEDVREDVAQAAKTLLNSRLLNEAVPDPRLSVWRRLIARQHGLHEAEELPLPSHEPAPLLPLGLDDLIDSWTYYELVGLHGMHLCGLLESDPGLTQRTRSAAEYHLGHTQPDYTTYQPWGLAAFAADPMTAVFAEQQLHDVATHLSIEGPGGAVLPALLLADSVAAMSGTLKRVWCTD